MDIEVLSEKASDMVEHLKVMDSNFKNENEEETYRPEEDVQLPSVNDLTDARKIDIDTKQKEMDIEVLSEKSSDMVERLKVMESSFKDDHEEEECRPEEDVQLPGVDDLPLFASAEARKIDIDIKQKEMDIEVLSEKASDMVERLKVMKSHFKNVQQELDHTNELSTAKQAEMKTEKHLQQLTSRAVGQNQAETKRLTLALEKLVIKPFSAENAGGI
jgi:hypothetical protein